MSGAGSASAAAPSASDAQPQLGPTPSILRRLAAFLYEGVLLFGVLMISGYLYSSLVQMRHALHGRAGMMAFLFLILGIYFVWFWSRGGQTVAMKAWHIRVLDSKNQPVSQARALARYLLSWLWFLPALATLGLFQFSGLLSSVVLLMGVATYAALAFLHPDRQFWHDAACGTRLVTWRPPAPGAKPKA